MKKILQILAFIFNMSSFISILVLYAKGVSVFKIVISAISLLLFSFLYYILIKNYNFDKRICLMYLSVMWVLFFLKILFDFSFQFFLVADIGIKIIIFIMSQSKPNDKEQSGDGSMIGN